MADLSRKIHFYNDGEEDFEGKWDGEEFTIEPGECIDIQAGVAEHFISKNPEAQLRVEEIPEESIIPRTPGNPLENNKRGASFSKLKEKAGEK